MNEPKVTVVVPCYNQAQYLPDALNSVLAQSYQNWECVIVNDGSLDQTREVALSWAGKDKRFLYIERKNGGLSCARNTGILAATGEYFQFLDADDLIEKRKLEVQTKLSEGGKKGIVVSDARYFENSNPSMRRFTIAGPNVAWMEPVWREDRPLIKKLMERNMMCVNSPLVHRRVVEKVGLFDEKLNALEDWHFWLRCALKSVDFLFDSSDGTLALVRVHSQSMSQDASRMERAGYVLCLRIARYLENPEMKRLNFMIGGDRIRGANDVLASWRLLRLGLANWTSGMPRLLWRANLGRHPRCAKMIARIRRL